jgi:EAL domain-containing protein (putative c-di-GMP-specific phosphodiesterase class I)
VEPTPAPERPDRAVSDSGVEDVRAALRAGDLLLYAQPAIDLRSGEVAHREVLVRMRGSADSVLPASDVLAAAAQEPGLCAEIDRWVVDQALASLANGSRGTRLHINLSGETLNDGRALARFVRVLHGAAERTRWLGLEIGEAAIQRNVVAASAAARQLAATGCPLVLDGFTGTQGAFEQLQRLPLDQVKIGGPVTRELMEKDADDATLRAIVRLAHGTGKTTVASRVESRELVPILRRRGVDMAQGFELGSPSPLGDPGD